MKLLNWSCQKIHCSVDDTLWIFKDLTEHKEYVSIFENPILNKIKELHLKFGAVFTCYCFFNAWYNFTLADATDRFTKEFEKNADWLKFGFHRLHHGDAARRFEIFHMPASLKVFSALKITRS